MITDSCDFSRNIILKDNDYANLINYKLVQIYYLYLIYATVSNSLPLQAL